MQVMTATIKKRRKDVFNIFINADGKKIPVGTQSGGNKDIPIFKTTDFDTYEDAVKWIEGSKGKFMLKEDK